jgi:hypothetical protein
LLPLKASEALCDDRAEGFADRARAAVDRFRNGLGICLLEMGERDAGEASLREAMRGAPHMAGQAITTLAAASHGRFFLRPSAASKFLRVEKTGGF